jgi:hypothetical protein
MNAARPRPSSSLIVRYKAEMWWVVAGGALLGLVHYWVAG